MSRNWTPQQKNAIYATDGSVLVSAAAGSGKTAVLVERVIKLITREKNPLDVDRLLRRLLWGRAQNPLRLLPRNSRDPKTCLCATRRSPRK